MNKIATKGDVLLGIFILQATVATNIWIFGMAITLAIIVFLINILYE